MSDENKINRIGNIVAEVIGPFLIMLMVGSLAFFFVEIAHGGQHTQTLKLKFGLFTFAAVLISRISIQLSFERAALYGFALAMAIMTVTSQYVSVLAAAPIIAFIWWAASRLTWDVTFIGDTRDSSAHGIVELAHHQLKKLRARITGQPLSREELEFEGAAQVGSDEEPALQADRQPSEVSHTKLLHFLFGRRQSNMPGLWVFYFLIGAFPVFGIGQGFIHPENPVGRQYAATYFAVFMIAALILMMMTSLLGLNQYLKQRNAAISMGVARNWMMLGLMLAVGILAFTFWMPRPNYNFSIAGWLPRLAAKQRDSQDPIFSMKGSDPSKQGPSVNIGADPRDPNESQTSQSNKQGSAGNAGKSASQSPQKSDSANQSGASDQASSDQQGEPSSGDKQSNSQQSGGKQSGGKQPEGKQSGAKSTGSSPGSETKSQSQDQASTRSQQEQSPPQKSQSQPKPSASKNTPPQDSNEPSKSERQSPTQSKDQRQADHDDNSGTQSPEQQQRPTRRPNQNDQDGNSEPSDPQQETGTDQTKTQDSKQDKKLASPGLQPQRRNNREDTNQPKQSGGSSNQQSQNRSDAQPNRSESPNVPDNSSSNVTSPQFMSHLGSFLQMIFWLVLLVAGCLLAYRYRTEIAKAYRKFLDDLRNFWNNLFKRPTKANAAEQVTSAVSTFEGVSFAQFEDPFLSGQVSSWEPEKVVMYTFRALEAWGRDNRCPREPDQTPIEFAKTIQSKTEDMHRGPADLASLYCQIAYAPESISPGDAMRLRSLWEAMRTTSLRQPRNMLLPTVS